MLLAAMEEERVKRLVCITGVGAGETKGHGGFIYDHLIFPLFTKNRYADKERQEQMIRQSNADWTIVRPAPFSEAKPRRDFQVVTEVGMWCYARCRGPKLRPLCSSVGNGALPAQMHS